MHTLRCATELPAWTSASAGCTPISFPPPLSPQTIDPGPVRTRLGLNMPPLATLRSMMRFEQTPAQVASLVCRTMGRAWMFYRDTGLLGWGCRLVFKIVDQVCGYDKADT